MARIPKFRIKSGLTQKWIYYTLQYRWDFSESIPPEELNKVDQETLTQFTGLKDKNGKEIYDGDIFKHVLKTDKKGIVKFGEYKNCFDANEISFGGHVGFYVDWNNLVERKDLSYWAKHSEVIGNVFDTDLIK